MVLSSILNDVASDNEDLSSNSSEEPQDEFEESEGGDEDNADISNEDYDGGEDDDDEEEDDEEEDEDDDEEDEDEEDEDEDDEPPLGEAESEDETVGNAGWADAMAKVLAMGKNSTKPVSVLSKAKKGNSKKRKSSDGEGSSDSEAEPEKKLEPLAVRKAKKKEIDSIGRKIPNVLERNSERALSKIATRGVVQLFNAVRDHQKDVKTKLKDAGGSFRKQEKVYKNLDKKSFIEMLSGKSGSERQGSGESPPVKKQKVGTEGSGATNESSSWNILRDDYMLGAKLKDWDKDSDEET